PARCAPDGTSGPRPGAGRAEPRARRSYALTAPGPAAKLRASSGGYPGSLLSCVASDIDHPAVMAGFMFGVVSRGARAAGVKAPRRFFLTPEPHSLHRAMEHLVQLETKARHEDAGAGTGELVLRDTPGYIAGKRLFDLAVGSLVFVLVIPVV